MQFLLPATCKHHLWTLARLSRGDGLVPHKPWPGAKSWRGHGICALKGWRRLKSTAHILRVFFFLGRQRERPCTEEAPRSRLRLPASWACNQTSCARLSTSCRSRSSRATIRCPSGLALTKVPTVTNLGIRARREAWQRATPPPPAWPRSSSSSSSYPRRCHFRQSRQ
jgi:hypothetical protein